MKIKSLLKHNLMRAAMTLALILACAAAWAQTRETATYIDADGNTQTVTATVLTGRESDLFAGWYVVNSDITYTSKVDLYGDMNLILVDGKTMSIGTADSPISGANAIDGSNYYTLTIYGQSGQTGKLCAYNNSSSYDAVVLKHFNQHGGIVIINSNMDGLSVWGNLQLTQGSLNVISSGASKNAIYISNTLSISGGTLIANAAGYGIEGAVNFTGGNLTAIGTIRGITGNTNLNWTSTTNTFKCSKYGGNVTIAEGKTFYDGATPYSGTLNSSQKDAIAGKTLRPYSSNDFSVNNEGTEYTIHSETGWNVFCDMLDEFDHSTNGGYCFDGKTVKLGANISITRAAGNTGYHDFTGIFDGQGHTLTVNITDTGEQGTAPFRVISNGATIRNLHVTGSVTGTAHAAGLVGKACAGTMLIENCLVEANVNSTVGDTNGNKHCGGIVGHGFGNNLNPNNVSLTLRNCVYTGTITCDQNYIGGLQGWSDGNTLTLENCLFAGNYQGTATGTALFHPIALHNTGKSTNLTATNVFTAVAPSVTNTAFIAANGTKTTGRTTAPDNLGTQGATYSFMNMTVYQNGLYYNGLYYVAPTLSTDNNGAYLISSVDDWTNFCDMLYNNDTWNRFSGQTVKLTASIGTAESPVTRMAGYATHDFCGTFNGQGNTITVSLSSSGENAALFSYISNTKANPNDANDSPAAILNLKVAGTVTVNENASHKYAGGLVGTCWGVLDIENCHVSTVIDSHINGDGIHGGIVGRSASTTLTITGCVFDGQMLGSTTNACGGIVGYRHSGATDIYHTLFAPTALTMSETNSATFICNATQSCHEGCYYTVPFGATTTNENAQGTKVYSISKGEYVTTLEINGTATPSYDVSGLSFYSTGIKCGDVLFTEANDVVSLILGCTPPAGFTCTGYTATSGNLNGTTLTMPNENVTINVTLEELPEVSYIDENGDTLQCTAYTLLDGTETSLGTADQETWYVADGTLNYGQTITLSGDVHLILKDNAVMNVGTQSTITYGIGDGSSTASISIYGQSTGNSKGQLHVNASAVGIFAKDSNLTINGGEVVVTSSGTYGLGIFANGGNITISGGEVKATGSENGGEGIIVLDGANGGSISISNATVTATGSIGIHAKSGITINSGTVTANNGNYGIYASSCSLTINGGQVTANGSTYGIRSEGDLTLGWTNASDYIHANSYLAGGILSIAEGKAFIDEDNAVYSGTIPRVNGAYAINGKTLYPYIEGSVPYIDENGQWQLCTDYTTISDNTVTTFGQNDNVDRWYVVTGTVNFNSPISFMSNSNIIIAEGAVLNVGTAENPVSGYLGGIFSHFDLKIYAESGTTGHVSVYSASNRNAIFGDAGELVIVNCEVNASGSVGIINNLTGINIVGCQLNLAGENGVKSATGPVTLKNTTLTAPSLTEKVIYSPVDLTLDSCTVVAATSATNVHAIESYGGTNGIIIKNNSNINVETTTDLLSNGIFSQMGVSIEGSTVKAKGNRGIVAGGALTITDATVKATGKSSAIWAGSSITLDGGQVTAESTSSSAICAYNGNITIRNNGKTIAESTNNYGCFAISAESGNVIIESGTVEATGIMGIYGKNVNISGGQVSATGPWYGVLAWSGNITLGWTNASDYIYANSYYADGGTLSIAEGKAFKDVDGNNYESGPVNASDINGKWLYPSVASLFTKTVTGYGTGNGGWVFIASPVAADLAPSEVHNLIATTEEDYDLYRFNQAAELEWENWKAEGTDNYHFNLEPGHGYLYATKETRTLVFAGEYTAATGSVDVPLTYDENAQFAGWNLVGNPFNGNATLTQPYYRMNAEGTALKTETENTPVAAMEGVFVKANEDGEIVTFGVQTRGGEKRAVAALNIQVGPSTGSGTSVIDNAIIRFDGGQTLEKFSFRKGSTKIYIPQDGKDYAIATSNGQGEMPVNFKAKENGTYTLTVSTTLNSKLSTLNFNYLHLIDNMTGANVDLLASPTYTFTAKTTDYESRFKLVFSTNDADGSSTGSDTFAFISNGNLIVNGEGTLQVFDVLGHQLVTKQLSTLNSQLSTLNYIPGVYMLRLINGNDVRTQKMVVR